MKNTKELLNLENVEIKYITNALGEKNFPVSDEIYNWYCDIGDTEFLHYLVELNGEFGLLAILEITNPDSDTWNDDKQLLPIAQQNLSSADFFADLKTKAIVGNEQINNSIVLGEHTGINDTHEYCVFFPLGTDKQVVSDELKVVIDLFN